MMMHIIYRTYAGENKKARPTFYSKDLALASLLRSFEAMTTQAEIVFMNDGDVPADRIATMMAYGEVIVASNLGNKGSLRKALRLAEQRKWPGEDLIWFAEDDYIYTEAALNDLAQAALANAGYNYFGLYALIGDRQPNGEPHIDCRIPSKWKLADVQTIAGGRWSSALSTTSTYGCKVRALAADRAMMDVAMATGGAFDHTISLAYQGFAPFSLKFLKDAFQTSSKGFLTRIATFSARSLSVFAFFLWDASRSRPHNLLAADPALISHMESENMALGRNWKDVATSVSAWAAVNPKCRMHSFL